MRPERLLRLDPRAWRERYGDEFLAVLGPQSLQVQQVIDILSGAIDAWLSADVRRVTMASQVARSGGGPMKSLAMCERKPMRVTTRDALIGAGIMIAATLFLTTMGVAARQNGWAASGEFLTYFAFPGSFTLSMPFWSMKGQPWKAQVVIVGGTLTVLAGIGYLNVM